MASKRKAPIDGIGHRTKRPRTSRVNTKPARPHLDRVNPGTYHAVLSSLYPTVLTLRTFLQCNLAPSSRVRRRSLRNTSDEALNCLLDTCLVGVLHGASDAVRKSRQVEFASFTQTQTQRRGSGRQSSGSQALCMNEIVDFTIWSLFKSCPPGLTRPRHILCHGLQRQSNYQGLEHAQSPDSILPGVVRLHPNDNIESLKSTIWDNILSLLGGDGWSVILSLLLDCGIFVQVPTGRENYFQLSGVPITDLPNSTRVSQSSPDAAQLVKKPNQIRFVRNRAFYGKPSLTRDGSVKFGLKHVHVLERYPVADQLEHSVHILKYIFPRQFRLHNVFTSKVDPTETAQTFKDYTFREVEISNQRLRSATHLPRRLRGSVISWVKRLQGNHQRCSYSQLLRHYCGGYPYDTTTIISRPPSRTSEREKTSFLPYSTPAANVSAFCRATIGNLLPPHTFGKGTTGRQNIAKIMMHIDQFILMRRFESMSLHQVIQGISITSIPWLRASQTSIEQHLSKSEHNKRVELFCELVYYVFDSLVIPLIRNNFYVTETSTLRNRLVYFRHDVWRKLSEPSVATLRLSMYTPIKVGQTLVTKYGRNLGYSQLRLLPKDEGARPITNFRRKQIRVVGGKRVLGPSVNAQLGPVFGVLNLEKTNDSAPLASAIMSVGEIHSKLASFKSRLPAGSRLYFVKVDIQSCFDSIPQRRLLHVIRELLSDAYYRTTKHTEFKAAASTTVERLSRRYVTSARAADDRAVISEDAVAQLAAKKRRTVFSETGAQRTWSQASLLHLLQEHVQNNITQIGKRHLKQIDGIPQGSILSSLLCSYFYGAFEKEKLGFLDTNSCLLLRLIDDFLLVSTDGTAATRFLEIMTGGDQEYGISVNAQKSLVNFDVTIGGIQIPRVHGQAFFPYCGMAIEMQSLELRKDREKKDAFVSNALTVERALQPGATLRRKLLSSLKLQMHAMLLDLKLNSKAQVVSTLMSNFTESAMKMHRYMVSLGRKGRVPQELVRGLLEELITVGTKFAAVRSDGNQRIPRGEMCWAAACAFEAVLMRKQSQYRHVLTWIQTLRTAVQARVSLDRSTMGKIIRENERLFQGYVY